MYVRVDHLLYGVIPFGMKNKAVGKTVHDQYCCAGIWFIALAFKPLDYLLSKVGCEFSSRMDVGFRHYIAGVVIAGYALYSERTAPFL